MFWLANYWYHGIPNFLFQRSDHLLLYLKGVHFISNQNNFQAFIMKWSFWKLRSVIIWSFLLFYSIDWFKAQFKILKMYNVRLSLSSADWDISLSSIEWNISLLSRKWNFSLFKECVSIKFTPDNSERAYSSFKE